MVHVHDMSSEYAVQMFEVSFWIPLTVIKLYSGHEIALQLIKGKWLQNIHSRVMVHVHDASSECALQMYDVSLKYF